jgi:hypothetical protein
LFDIIILINIKIILKKRYKKLFIYSIYIMNITNKDIQNNNNNNLEAINVRKKYKRFKDYYRNEDFRRKHLEYLSTPLKCECGAIVQRGYLNVHRKKETFKCYCSQR